MARRAQKQSEGSEEQSPNPLAKFFGIVGPGVITGGADNDPSGIVTYSTAGATTGYSQLWLMLLSTPLLLAVQAIAARLGDVTKLGLAELLRNEFGRWIAISVGLLVVVANVATIGADLVGMASVLELLTHIRLIYFIVPLVVVMGYVTVFQDFKVIEKMLLWLVVVFTTYIVAGFLSHPRWNTVLASTFVPPLKPDLAYFTSAVGLLGTTITPYLFFWQTAAEREARRGVEELKTSYIDVFSGMIYSNVIAYFIIISTASTLYAHHRSISTARDAAAALKPFAGDFATLLFSIGILGAGLLAIPILSISTGYVVAGTFGWRMGLGREAFSAPGFYAVIVLALLAGVELAISGFSPIKAMFYSQVLDGLVAPVLLVCMLILVSRPGLMGRFTASIWEKIGGWSATAVMVIADIAFIYSLAGAR